MNHLFGNILVPIKTFFKDNIRWRENTTWDKYSEFIFTTVNIYNKLRMNMSFRRFFESDLVSVGLNTINTGHHKKKKFKDYTYVIHVYGYPYVWHYTPTTEEFNMNNHCTIETYIHNKFKAIYKQSKKF